jgi:uncharacterized repeat protein (TIGR01451 family)
MDTNERTSVSRLAAITVACLVGVIGMFAASNPTTATAAASRAPQLSIAVSDGHASVVAGDLLHYTVVVKNLGATKLSNLVISQSEPSGMTLLPATSVGVANRAGVEWRLSLKPNASTEVHADLRVMATPASDLRLATVACVRTSVTASPIVCASHLDQLPAGLAASDGSSSRGPWWYVGGGSGLLIVIAGLFAFRRRRLARAA